MSTGVNHHDRDQSTGPDLVPAGAPDWVTAELISDTLSTWQPYYADTLTPEDALRIILNVGRFIDVLVLDAEGRR